MEKRLLLAMVLSILILILFQFLFIKPQKPEVKPGEVKEEETIIPEGKSMRPEPAEKIPPLPRLEEAMGEEEKEVTVKTPLYTAQWTNRGAVLTSWRLNRYSMKRMRAWKSFLP